MALPWWAYLLGSGYAADKFVLDPIKSGVDLGFAVRDKINAGEDRDVMNDSINKGRAFDPKYYNDPVAASTNYKKLLEAKDETSKLDAIPILQKFTKDYSGLVGGTEPRFYGDPAFRAELQRQGLKEPVSDNPYVNQGLLDFAKQGERQILRSKVLDNTATPNELSAYADAAGKQLSEENTFVKNIMDARKPDRQKISPNENYVQFDKEGNATELYTGAPKTETINPEQLLSMEAKTYLSTVFGDQLTTPEGFAQGMQHLATPEGQQGLKSWIDATSAARFNVAPPTNIVLGSDPNTGNVIVGNSRGEVNPRAIPTGPLVPKNQSPMTPEAAAKSQLIDQAIGYLPDLKKGLFDDKGNVNRLNVNNLATRMPFTEGRRLSTLILDSVEAKLRAESGAAVPETEVKRIAKRYIPQVGDDDRTIKTKYNMLNDFLKGTAQKMNAGKNLQKGVATQKTVVERRKTANGGILVKYSDGTIGRE